MSTYIDLRCALGPYRTCGAVVHLEVCETCDLTEDGWTWRVNGWQIVCDNGHLHADATDVHEDNEKPPLPTVMFARSLPHVRERGERGRA